MQVYLFLVALLVSFRCFCGPIRLTHRYENLFRVGANSPSLYPTISSETLTGMYSFPLCTWNSTPTWLGRIVHARAFV